MKPGDKNPYEYKLPQGDSDLEKFIKQDNTVKKAEQGHNLAPTQDKMPAEASEKEDFYQDDLDSEYSEDLEDQDESDSREEPEVIKNEDVETYPIIKKLDARINQQLTEFREAMERDPRPGFWAQNWYALRILGNQCLLLPLVIIWGIHSIYVLMFPRGPKDIVGIIWGMIKFLWSLVIWVVVKIVELLHVIHAIHIFLIVVFLILAVIFAYVINPIFATTTSASLDFKGTDNKAMHITNNKTAKDVSFSELQAFLAGDDSDQQVSTHSGVALSGAVRLHNSAENAGIRAGVAEITWAGTGPKQFCWDVFDTTDYGTVYISAYHPTTRITGDSLVYIPKTGPNAGICYFIPVDSVRVPANDHLTEAMAQGTMDSQVVDIKVIW